MYITVYHRLLAHPSNAIGAGSDFKQLRDWRIFAAFRVYENQLMPSTPCLHTYIGLSAPIPS